MITPATTTTAPSFAASSINNNVDQNPISVAIDPEPFPANTAVNYAAVGTSSQASSVEIIDLSTLAPQRISGFQNPTGIIFDPLNQVFVVANSLNNNLVIVDPVTLVQTPVRVGIDPTALDYDYQTSTLVTSNLCKPDAFGARLRLPAHQRRSSVLESTGARRAEPRRLAAIFRSHRSETEPRGGGGSGK